MKRIREELTRYEEWLLPLDLMLGERIEVRCHLYDLITLFIYDTENDKTDARTFGQYVTLFPAVDGIQKRCSLWCGFLDTFTDEQVYLLKECLERSLYHDYNPTHNL